MKRILNIFAVFTILMVFLTGCDNFLNSNEDFNKLLETDIDYAKAPLVNVLVGHNNDDFGTVGSGVVNYSVTAKVGYPFEVSFALKSTAGNFVAWNAYTKYDPDVPANCKLLDKSYIEFIDNSQNKLNAKVKILKRTEEQIRLVPEVTAFPVMEVCLPSELLGITPAPAAFNPPQPVKALTPGQEYSITATTTVDYGFSDNPEECWKVYRKDSLGNEIEIADGANITIGKNTGTQLANGKSQSTIYITVDEEFSGRFYVSPKLITYPSMKVEIENFDSSLVKMSHSGTVPMAEGTPYEISLQTDPTVGFKGWKFCKRNNITLEETEELFPADSSTTTKINTFTDYSDDYVKVTSPTYEVSETGKTSGKVNASIKVTLMEEMDDLEYSYYLLPQFFRYPVVNVYSPDGYATAGCFSLTGAGYIENDTVRMMMDDYEYTITYKTTEDYSFAEPYWVVYETSDPSKNLLGSDDARIELLESSVVIDESRSSSCSVSVILKHDFGTTLNIKPVVAQKPSMNISFDAGTPNGINLSLGGNTITSGSVNQKAIKMSTGKVYTATVNVPKGYLFEGWKLVRENSSNDKLNWITESTDSTTGIIDSATLDFDSAALSENPSDYIRLYNAKYSFEHEGRNAGTTKATVDISFKKELSDFSLNLVPVIKAVPEISFAAVNSDYGNLLPAASDVRNLYPETKIDLTFKSTKQATAGKKIWKIKKWNPDTRAYSDDYSASVGYTSLDLTAALNDEVLKTKDIIIYNNDNEAEVQPNSKGEYITTKTAVLYVNKMPEANLQLSVTPEVYNTIKFVSGTDFLATSYDSEVYIPAGETFNFELKTKSGYRFTSLGTPANGTNTDVTVTAQNTGYDGVSTVSGTIKSTKNNGDAVTVTPEAAAITKVIFGKPVLSSSLSTEEESSGTMVPAPADFIYQLEGNSTAIRFETSGEYTYQGFAAGNIRFTDVSNTESDSAVYVLSTGTLVQAKEKAPLAKLIIHDLVETELTDSQGQIKKRVTGTLSVVSTGSSETVKPVVAPKPSMNISFDAGTPNGIILSLGGNSITSGSVDHKSMKMTTGKIYTATLNVPKGYSFEGWRLVREIPSGEKLNWITESTKSTTEISENADLAFDSEAGSENPSDYVRLNNAQYSFELEGRNAGITKATVDISFKKELSDFSLNLIPVINAVPEISFVAVDPDYGTLTPAASDVRNLYLGTKIDLSFKSTKRATAGKKIWKIKKWDSGTGAYSDYSEKVGYTDLDLTAALKDDDLKTKDIIIYNNDKEVEVQPNSKGEYITTKTAVLYVNKMPEAKLQVSVIPEVYNTIKFVPGTDFLATAYDSETYIPAGVTFNFTMKTKAGYEFDSMGTPENGSNTEVTVTGQTTGYDGISTVSGTIKSTKNNGDAVIVTPSATAITKVTFGKPVLSSNLLIEEESAGSMVPSTSEYIYQIEGNSTAIRFETSGDYTYEGFAAGNTRFVNVSETADNEAPYVLSTGTLSQSKEKAANAKLVLHDIIETELTDNQGQTKKRVTGTLTVVTRGTSIALKVVAAPKPSMNISFDAGTPNGINLSLDGNIITSGSVNHKAIKMTTGKTYTATVNIPKGYSFEGWRLVREVSSGDALNWITESTKTTTDIVESATINFDSGVSSENPGDYVRLFNAKYTFENEGRNAGTTKATVDISFKKQLSDFSLNLIPVIKSVPEISFVTVNSDYGTLSPSASDVRNLYPETKIDLTFKSTKQATAGKEIWKIKKWDSASGAYSIDYSANVGYTSLDLTAALKDSELKTKDIIIYNNDNEAEVQPNSKGEYITTKTAVLYVNKMPDAKLQLYVEPEVYNTIKFVPGDNFESTIYDSPVIIPAGKTFDFTIKTKAGYKFSSLGTIVNNANTSVPFPSQTTSNSGVSTVTGTITSNKNNGDAVVVTPEASQIYKLCFGKPVLSTLTDTEDAGTMIPADTDFIYQVAGNSTSIRFETTGEYTFEGFGAISENQTNVLNNFLDIDDPNARGKYYVFTSGTLAQAKDKIPKAKLIIHDLVETDLTDSQGQAKKRVTGTFTIVEERKSNYTIKPVVKAKPSFAVNLDNAEKGSVSPSTAKAILINEDYSISYISSSGYGFEKWSVTEAGTNVPVLTRDEAAGAAGTSATSFVVDLGSVQELTGNNSLSNIQTALGSNRAKLLAVIYNSSKVESQATEGVETATAKFRIVQDIASAIAVSPVTYQHSYFYVANNANATVTPASTSKAMVKKGRDYDFRIVTNTNYMYSTLSFSGATVANAGSTINPTFSSYTTQDAVCYNLVPTVNKETGVVTVTGKLRMLKEAEKTIVITPVINTFPKITLSEETSGDTTRLTLGNNTVSGGSITASMISDYEKSGTTYVTKYIDYDIEAVPSDSKGAYKFNTNSSQPMFKVYNSTGTLLTTGLQITDSTTCPAFNSNSNLIIYDYHLVSMENGNYKVVAKIRVKSGTYTIKPVIYTQPKIAIQSINACDITSITFDGQRTSSDSISSQTLYTNGGQPRNYEFSIKIKEGFAVYTENAESPEDSNPNPAGVSLKAYSPANEELSCGYNYAYNLYNKNGDSDVETPTIIHEIEQNFDGTNYVLTGKIRSFEDTNIVLKPNVYKVPVINFDQPYFEKDNTTPGELIVNNKTQNQTYASQCLISSNLNFTYTASTGYYIKEFKVYDASNALKSTYSVGPFSITAGTSVAGLSFSNLSVATAAKQRISGTLTVTAPSVDGYKIVPVYVKGSLGPSLSSCSLSYFPVKYTNKFNRNETTLILTNSTGIKASTIRTDVALSPEKNEKYYKDNTASSEGGTQIASNEAKYTSTSLKNVFTGATGANSFSVELVAKNINFPNNESYIPVKIKVTEKLTGLYPNMYYMTERDEKTTVRVTASTEFDSDSIPEIYNCAKTLINTSQTITTDKNFTKETIEENDVTTATFTFGLNFNIPYGGIHQFEISAIDSKGNETEKRTICLEYPRPEFSDEEQDTYLKNPAALRKAGGTTMYVRYINKPTSDTYPYIAYYSTTTGKCHFTKPSFLTNGFDETISILKRSTSSQSACIRLANTAGFFSLSSKESSSMTTSIAGPGDIVYRKLNSDKKYVCPLDDYLANPSIGEPIAVIVSGTGSSSDTKTIGNRILGMGLKVPTQDYYYPGKLKFFNDITETLGTGENARSYQVADLIKSSVSSVICGKNDGQGKNNLTDFQSVAFNKMTTAAGVTVPYAITGSNARSSSSQSFPVFSYAAHYAGIELNGFGGENWYIPSVAEMKFVQDELSMITNVLKTLNVTPLNEAETCWTSTFDTTSTATNPREVYTYPLNMGSYYTGRSVDPIIVNYTTVSPAYAVRVFYDFTDELEVE